MTVAEFIAARLSEDDSFARATMRPTGPSWAEIVRQHRIPDGAHIARHDPARVLRQVAAMRAILAMHGEEPEWKGTCCVCLSDRESYPEMWRPDDWPCAMLRHMATVWSDHPDYDEAWRP